MPCYQVNTMTLDFHALDRDVFDRAVKTLDWTIDQTGDYVRTGMGGKKFIHRGDFVRIDRFDMTIDFAQGIVNVPSNQQHRVNQLKRAYSMEAIKTAAMRNGWSMMPQTATTGKIVRY